MAFDSFRVYRVPNTWQDEEAEHLARMLDAVARSREVLKCPTRLWAGSLKSRSSKKGT